jgi:CBS domain-containing protein
VKEMGAPDDVSTLVRRVGGLLTRAAVTCGPATTAAEIAQLMSREGVGSLVVVSDERPVGIVTDRDLRRKVVGEGRDPRTIPASALMSSPVISLSPDAFVLDALVLMTRRGIHHLAVVAEGRLVGVISSSDVLRLELPHPVAVSRDIAAANSLDALKRPGSEVVQITRRLVVAGASAVEVGALVAELNDQLVRRVLELTGEQLASAGSRAPVPYCWLAFGSEARREQTLRTDQDNGLVYADPPPGEAAAATAYYARFAETAVRGLVTIGFPACPGNVMASNPALCRPLSGWLENFARWMDHPSPSEVLAASIHFDLRPVAGVNELASELSALIASDAPKRRVFLGMLARDVVSRPPPLTLFGRVATRRGRIDVKSAAAMPLVGAARIHALELSLREVNTVERFRAAGARGLYTPDENTEITEAYQHILRLRLVHQLAQLDHGLAPDNLIAPRSLSRAHGLLLSDAFRTVARVQAGLRERFRTDLLG